MDSQALLRTATQTYLKKVPALRTGYTVIIHQKIKEGGKERIQKFQGLIIKIGSGNGVNKTFTVRGLYSGVGVEKTFPVHSPNIKKIDVIKKAKVRQSKLYYMRGLVGKAARLQEEYMREETESPVKAEEVPKKEEIQEAAEKPKETEEKVEEKKEEAKKAEKVEAETPVKKEEAKEKSSK